MSNSSSVGQRFLQLIQQLGMSKNAFAISLNKTATVIQHLVDERNKPGFDLMRKLFEVYPNVSKDWLLMGEGPMLLGVAEPTAVASPAEPASVVKPVNTPPTPSFPTPLFTVSAARPLASELAASAPPRKSAAPETNVPLTGAAPTASVSPPIPVPVVTASASVVPQPVVPLSTPALVSAPPVAPEPAYLTAALHAQHLQHQLALAEQRNQHLLDQQALMQQMLDLMRRTV